MKTYMQLVQEISSKITEIMPWDVEGKLSDYKLVLDIRESYEFSVMKIKNSINVPRGVLESACEWNYEETVPELVNARNEKILVVCRSGHRSALAVYNMKKLGYHNTHSLKTGLRGWFEFDQILVDNKNRPISEDTAEQFFESQVKKYQLKPKENFK